MSLALKWHQEGSRWCECEAGERSHTLQRGNGTFEELVLLHRVSISTNKKTLSNKVIWLFSATSFRFSFKMSGERTARFPDQLCGGARLARQYGKEHVLVVSEDNYRCVCVLVFSVKFS